MVTSNMEDDAPKELADLREAEPKQILEQYPA